jgi:hypothetical protein
VPPDEKRELAIRFRSKSGFEDEFKRAEGDGIPSYSLWILSPRAIGPSHARDEEPALAETGPSALEGGSQEGKKACMYDAARDVLRPSDTSHEQPMPVENRRSALDAGKEATQPAAMFDPVRNP